MSKQKTTAEFIQQAKEIHGNKFDYSLTEYTKANSKIKIKCNTCGGIFEQRASAHLYEAKVCPLCSGTRNFTQNDFIQKAKTIYGDRFDYSLVNYKNYDTVVDIICYKHGVFKAIPKNFLSGRTNCPYCSKHISSYERKVLEWLKNKNIKFEHQYKFDDLKGNKDFLRYDFYIPIKNLLIEVNGIQHYKINPYFKDDRKTFLLRKHYDWLKRKYAEKHNIKLLVIPYWKFSNLEEILTNYCL